MEKFLDFFVQSIPDSHLIHPAEGPKNPAITHITADSRQVHPGTLFVAVVGISQNGHDYIDQAISSGAVAIVGQVPPDRILSVPYIWTKEPTQIILAHLASLFYDHPSHSMLLIGVTGTSGKTTLTYLMESILIAAGHSVGVIGTINTRFGSTLIPSQLTTPNAVDLQKYLWDMKNAHCTAVVMEVSSHALKQGRAHGIAFDRMLFNNLSPEHLDFHVDMDDYFNAKKILFTEIAQNSIKFGKIPIGIFNQHDSYGLQLSQKVSIPMIPFVDHSNLLVHANGITGKVNSLQIQSSLTGNFNCLNFAAAITIAQSLNIDPSAIQNGINLVKLVPGRMEKVSPPDSEIHVWVDYAHKPDALQQVLETLKAIKKQHRLITVFGCGGDRDRQKRPLMGHIATQHSDFVFITSDNPRSEPPLQIIQEIVTGTQGATNVQIEPDRRKAIFLAIERAQVGDFVLIAGKGHENYQINGTQTIPFDDGAVAKSALSLKISAQE